MGAHKEFATKDDLEKSLGKFKGEIIHEFHLISEGLMDHIKLLAEGHSGVVERLDRMETRFNGVESRLDRVENRLDHMEKENERQHIETRALIKISFSELERRLSDLETQMKEMQEWRKQLQGRLQI
ncbi:MAG: hypothetical protein AB1502_08840 [Thermodesulfobacteriota bacterium]